MEKCDWKCTPEAHFGTDNDIHIWNIPFLTLEQHGSAGLSTDEKQRLKKFKNTQAKNIFASSRIVMRKLFSSYLGIPADKIKIATHSQGKPYLKTRNRVLEFNLSHSGQQIILAVSASSAVGIDIEAFRKIDNWQAIARKVFDNDLLQLLMNSTEPETLFTRFWTEFEARQKLSGQGVFGKPVLPAHNIETFGFVPHQGYHATLACYAENKLPDIRFFSYNVSALIQ